MILPARLPRRRPAHLAARAAQGNRAEAEEDKGEAVVKEAVEVAAAAAANEAAEKAEMDTLVNAVVKANLLTEPVARTMPLAALKELSNKAAPVGNAANLLNGGAPLLNGDEDKAFDLNALLEVK